MLENHRSLATAICVRGGKQNLIKIGRECERDRESDRESRWIGHKVKWFKNIVCTAHCSTSIACSNDTRFNRLEVSKNRFSFCCCREYSLIHGSVLNHFLHALNHRLSSNFYSNEMRRSIHASIYSNSANLMHEVEKNWKQFKALKPFKIQIGWFCRILSFQRR